MGLITLKLQLDTQSLRKGLLHQIKVMVRVVDTTRGVDIIKEARDHMVVSRASNGVHSQLLNSHFSRTLTTTTMVVRGDKEPRNGTRIATTNSGSEELAMFGFDQFYV